MVNSTWTLNHIRQLWWRSRHRPPALVYPPCDTEALRRLPLDRKLKKLYLIAVAQFRPEKNHGLLLRSYALALEQAGARLLWRCTTTVPVECSMGCSWCRCMTGGQAGELHAAASDKAKALKLPPSPRCVLCLPHELRDPCALQAAMPRAKPCACPASTWWAAAGGPTTRHGCTSCRCGIAASHRCASVALPCGAGLEADKTCSRARPGASSRAPGQLLRACMQHWHMRMIVFMPPVALCQRQRTPANCFANHRLSPGGRRCAGPWGARGVVRQREPRPADKPPWRCRGRGSLHAAGALWHQRCGIHGCRGGAHSAQLR